MINTPQSRMDIYVFFSKNIYFLNITPSVSTSLQT